MWAPLCLWTVAIGALPRAAFHRTNSRHVYALRKRTAGARNTFLFLAVVNYYQRLIQHHKGCIVVAVMVILNLDNYDSICSVFSSSNSLVAFNIGT